MLKPGKEPRLFETDGFNLRAIDRLWLDGHLTSISNDTGKIGAIRLQIIQVALNERESGSHHGLNEKFIVLLPPIEQDND